MPLACRAADARDGAKPGINKGPTCPNDLTWLDDTDADSADQQNTASLPEFKVTNKKTRDDLSDDAPTYELTSPDSAASSAGSNRGASVAISSREDSDIEGPAKYSGPERAPASWVHLQALPIGCKTMVLVRGLTAWNHGR